MPLKDKQIQQESEETVFDGGEPCPKQASQQLCLIITSYSSTSIWNN